MRGKYTRRELLGIAATLPLGDALQRVYSRHPRRSTRPTAMPRAAAGDSADHLPLVIEPPDDSVPLEAGTADVVPFTLTNTGTSPVAPDDIRVTTNIGVHPDLHLREQRGPAGVWTQRDNPYWQPIDPVPPSESLPIDIPVQVADGAWGLYTVKLRAQHAASLATATVTVPPVPTRPVLDLRIRAGSLSAPEMERESRPIRDHVRDAPVCLGSNDRAGVYCYLRNGGRQPSRQTLMTVTVPSEWGVTGIYRGSWRSGDSFDWFRGANNDYFWFGTRPSGTKIQTVTTLAPPSGLQDSRSETVTFTLINSYGDTTRTESGSRISVRPC